ncbi:hypothetical protein E5K00_05535 [Hymenobacter aquaticus]|uniref:Glycosyltransferase RgtA/B/C/D-like domain-containing protein n=1 Tax=Hymenobacter aquaticus TaxID=1867101 RepID=A0A4Z0Q504_9BACT|nr:hypothetical protein [Hymenobacter aquaticus]TGE24674.1 hypothetical protein E5K00_05535 [Hymenobacter aquaticus]
MHVPRFLRVVVLPLLLLLSASAGLGCYFETNDDLSIVLLLQGRTAAAPVTDLHLYFHGLAPLLAGLYQQFPAVPWYGLLLYGLLYLAGVLVFAVLDRLLQTRLAGGPLTLLLSGFYGLAWLEHGLWFNYVRVPILLAGAALLLAAQRAARRRYLLLAGLALALAWLIRPSAALLGVLAAAPGAVWLAGRRGASLVGGAGLLLAVASLVLWLGSSPATATYRTLDVLKSNLNDYQLYQPRPRTPADRLGLQAVEHWVFGDARLVNAGLFQRAARFEPAAFLRDTVPAKMAAWAGLLARDYFALLVLLALSWLLVARSQRFAHRSGFWLGQLFFLGLLLGLGLVLKLPPRLGMPLMGLWLLSNLAYVLRDTRRPLPRLSPLLLAVVSLLLVAYAFKTTHRVQVLRQERAAGLAVLRQLERATQAGQLVVGAGLEAAYKSQSPFESLRLTPHSVLGLTGWPTLDPSQPAFRRQLTGTAELAPALAQLAAHPATQWWLTPELAAWLPAYLAAHQWRAYVQPVGARPAGADHLPGRYRVRVERMK